MCAHSTIVFRAEILEIAMRFQILKSNGLDGHNGKDMNAKTPFIAFSFQHNFRPVHCLICRYDFTDVKYMF
jgi:hypothetical protein